MSGVWDIDYTWPGCEAQTDTVRALLEAASGLEFDIHSLNRRAVSRAKRRGCAELVELLNPDEPDARAANDN